MATSKQSEQKTQQTHSVSDGVLLHFPQRAIRLSLFPAAASWPVFRWSFILLSVLDLCCRELWFILANGEVWFLPSVNRILGSKKCSLKVELASTRCWTPPVHNTCSSFLDTPTRLKRLQSMESAYINANQRPTQPHPWILQCKQGPKCQLPPRALFHCIWKQRSLKHW